MTKTRLLQSTVATLAIAASAVASNAELLAHWRFEEVAQLNGRRAPSVAGESLTGRDNQAVNPRPYSYDESGNGNQLQVWEPRDGSNPSKTVFSDAVPVPQIDGKPNLRSLALKGRDYSITLDRLLAFSDLRKSWTIEASVMTRRTDDEQVFLCKEHTTGAQTADLAIGYAPTEKKFYLDVKDGDGELHRVMAGEAPEAGKWYDVRATANYDAKAGETTLVFDVNPSGESRSGQSSTTTYQGPALPKGAARWVVGRGFPYTNGKYVTDGGIDEIRISGEGLPRTPGQNPIFTDTFTADPAALVVGDTVYAYVGHDAAKVGQFFTMPDWRCYSSKDMKTWTSHGAILKAQDFKYGARNSAWAAQMIEKGGKYFFYVTLTLTNSGEHCIAVAVGDSPLGPFKDARGTPLITDGMTTDSRRGNADIDPTVFIDDDGTPWLAWGNGDCYLVKLKPNMIEMDGPIKKLDITSQYSEGPWLYKRGQMYYNVFAVDVPGVQPEQIGYATAPAVEGPWTYHGLVTTHAKVGFTIHPAVVEFKGQWYFFYHDGSTALNGQTGGDCRRSVCVEYLDYNPDGTIKPITQTAEGVSVPPKK